MDPFNYAWTQESDGREIPAWFEGSALPQGLYSTEGQDHCIEDGEWFMYQMYKELLRQSILVSSCSNLLSTLEYRISCISVCLYVYMFVGMHV